MASMYHSTRSSVKECSAKRAVLDGLAPDGGLYVTDGLGAERVDLDRIVAQAYAENAALILKILLDDYTDEEIAACVEAAYGDTFAAPETVPVVNVGDDYILELFHGPTSAFKDVALQMLPQLMSRAAASTSERIMNPRRHERRYGQSGPRRLRRYARPRHHRVLSPRRNV